MKKENYMNIIKMISKKNCYIGQNRPAYIVIHETDNWSKGADAKAHATAMKNGNLAGTVHYYVDSKSIYQTLDHSDGAWAVGDGKGKYGITNRNSISIEICVNPETDYYTAVDKTEQLAALLLKQYGWKTDRLKRHYDASGKHCPRRLMDEGKWSVVGIFEKNRCIYEDRAEYGKNRNRTEKRHTEEPENNKISSKNVCTYRKNQHTAPCYQERKQRNFRIRAAGYVRSDC